MKSLLKGRYVTNRIETLNFKDFMNGEINSYKSNTIKRRDFKAYSLYINPIAFFDWRFALVASAVVLVAVLEKKLAENGLTFIASAISGVLRVSFPVIAAASILYLLSHLSFL